MDRNIWAILFAKICKFCSFSNQHCSNRMSRFLALFSVWKATEFFRIIIYLDVDNIERTLMSFSVHNGSNSPCVTASSDHAQVTGFEFDGIHDFVGGNVQPKK